MKIAFYTLGCKVNQYETGAIANEFVKNGYEIVPFEETADIYVINTCSVTAESDRKSRQMIRRARRKNTDAVIAVCGCFPEGARDEAASLQEADIITGTAHKLKLIELVNNFIKDKKRFIYEEKISDISEFEDFHATDFNEKTRAFIKVEDGCENFCAYCIIPFLRGKIRSKPIDKAISEIKELACNGYKEIVLTGIHLTSYGKDIGEYSLIDLIEKAAETEGIYRIRLGSLEPGYINENIIERLKNVKKLCPHFHLSLQSGCDETLKRMLRKYTTKEYEKEVNLLKNAFSDCTITTDIIAGFPGETVSEFDKNLSFIDKNLSLNVHIFVFSRRKGTAADTMPNQIEKQLKILRSKKLFETVQKNRLKFLNAQIGKIYEVLFESETKKNIYEGFTENYIKVRVRSEKNIQNEILKVKIIEANKDFCNGEIL